MISYFDATNGNLKFARKDSNDLWYSYVVDSDEGAGLYTSIYGSNPTYVVSYYCISDSTIRVAYHGEGGATEESRTVRPATCRLGVFPNPLTDHAIIKCRVPIRGKVSLRIYDASGRETKTLLRAEKEPGDYDIEFDARGLSSGIYFVKLKIDPFAEAHSPRQALSPVRYKSARKIIRVR
jgi:hypothetical protein